MLAIPQVLLWTLGKYKYVCPHSLVLVAQDCMCKAESVTHHLGVPVLRHRSLKPSYSCIATIRKYFSSLRDPLRDYELIIVGDRILTDVVLANRMHRQSQPQPISTASRTTPSEEAELPKSRQGPLAIWTTGVWERESMIMRWWETRLVGVIDRWTFAKKDLVQETNNFVRKDTENSTQAPVGIIRRFLRPW